MVSAVFVQVAAPRTKSSRNLGSMAKISLHALLILKKHMTEFLGINFGRFCRSYGVNGQLLHAIKSLHCRSSVARGVAKYIFCAFEANFSSKNKNSPPQKGFGSRSGEGLAVVWTEIVEFFGSGAHLKSVKIFFF